jgi:hypothetical protein
MSVIYYSNLLTGGSSVALDRFDGNSLVVGDFSFTLFSTNVWYIHKVSTSTAVESSPNVIVPDVNPGTSSGSKRWLMQSFAGSAVPSTHADTHRSGGSDSLKLDDLATPDDNTDLNASSTRHGLLLKLSGSTTQYLRGDGAWGVAVPSTHADTHRSGGSDSLKLDDLATPDDNTDLNASSTRHGLLKKLSGSTSQFLDGDSNWATPKLQYDTSPQLAGNLTLNKKSLFHTVPSTDNAYEGVIMNAVAGEAIGFGKVCYYKSDGKFYKAINSTTATAKGMLGVAGSSIASSSSGVFVLQGFVRDNAWAYTRGAELFISTAAGNVGNKSTGVGKIVRLAGYAYSTAVMYFDPDKTYIEVSS